MSMLSLDNITFSYGDNHVFKDYSISFPTDKLSIIMSPSGSGKTTLLYLIAGLLKPETGSISYPQDKPAFSMVFQDSRLIEYISVESNIRLVNKNISNADILQCLDALGLKGFAHKKVLNLSGGEKQRVAIARALLADYDILLMDEPFTGLDDQIKETIIAYIKTKTATKTVLVVTHNNSEAEMLNGTVINLSTDT